MKPELSLVETAEASRPSFQTLGDSVKVHFGQCYIGVSFPMSHLFQRRLAKEVSALTDCSPKVLKKYGEGFELTFNVSAKEKLLDNEIRGASVYRKTKDIEYTIFLPFDVIMRFEDAPRHFLRFLLKGVCDVFDRLQIDKSKLVTNQEAIIEGICSDPTMLAEPSWNKEENAGLVRTVFTEFFQRKA